MNIQNYIINRNNNTISDIDIASQTHHLLKIKSEQLTKIVQEAFDKLDMESIPAKFFKTVLSVWSGKVKESKQILKAIIGNEKVEDIFKANAEYFLVKINSILTKQDSKNRDTKNDSLLESILARSSSTQSDDLNIVKSIAKFKKTFRHLKSSEASENEIIEHYEKFLADTSIPSSEKISVQLRIIYYYFIVGGPTAEEKAIKALNELAQSKDLMRINKSAIEIKSEIAYILYNYESLLKSNKSKQIAFDLYQEIIKESHKFDTSSIYNVRAKLNTAWVYLCGAIDKPIDREKAVELINEVLLDPNISVLNLFEISRKTKEYELRLPNYIVDVSKLNEIHEIEKSKENISQKFNEECSLDDDHLSVTYSALKKKLVCANYINIKKELAWVYCYGETNFPINLNEAYKLFVELKANDFCSNSRNNYNLGIGTIQITEEGELHKLLDLSPLYDVIKFSENNIDLINANFIIARTSLVNEKHSKSLRHYKSAILLCEKLQLSNLKSIIITEMKYLIINKYILFKTKDQLKEVSFYKLILFERQECYESIKSKGRLSKKSGLSLKRFMQYLVEDHEIPLKFKTDILETLQFHYVSILPFFIHKSHIEQLAKICFERGAELHRLSNIEMASWFYKQVSDSSSYKILAIEGLTMMHYNSIFEKTNSRSKAFRGVKQYIKEAKKIQDSLYCSSQEGLEDSQYLGIHALEPLRLCAATWKEMAMSEEQTSPNKDWVSLHKRTQEDVEETRPNKKQRLSMSL